MIIIFLRILGHLKGPQKNQNCDKIEYNNPFPCECSTGIMFRIVFSAMSDKSQTRKYLYDLALRK